MDRLEAEQPLVYSSLIHMVDRGQLPHAFIFYGDKSTSKMEMALFFIKYIYARLYGTSISDSPVTKRIDDGSFTNINIIQPEENKTNTSKDQMHGVIVESTKTSLEKGPKFFIFKDADSISEKISNKLLKFIEEPNDGVFIIFIAENVEKMLPTIRSRVIQLFFRPLNQEFLKERLDMDGIDENIAYILMSYTQKEDDIKAIYQNEDMMKVLSLVEELFNEPFEKKGSMILYMKEHLGLIDTVEEKNFFLNLYIVYLHDILNQVNGVKKDFVFRTEKVRIKELASLTDSASMSSLIKEAIDLLECFDKKKINFSLNLDLLLLDTERAIKKGV